MSNISLDIRQNSEQIVEKSISYLEGQLAEKNITIELSNDAKKYFSYRGYDKSYGARPLQRLIQKEIKDISPAGYTSEGSSHLLAVDGTLYGVGYGGNHQNGDYGGNNYSTPQPFIF